MSHYLAEKDIDNVYLLYCFVKSCVILLSYSSAIIAILSAINHDDRYIVVDSRIFNHIVYILS